MIRFFTNILEVPLLLSFIHHVAFALPTSCEDVTPEPNASTAPDATIVTNYNEFLTVSHIEVWFDPSPGDELLRFLKVTMCTLDQNHEEEWEFGVRQGT